MLLYSPYMLNAVIKITGCWFVLVVRNDLVVVVFFYQLTILYFIFRKRYGLPSMFKRQLFSSLMVRYTLLSFMDAWFAEFGG